MFSSHSTPEEFENGAGFSLKTSVSIVFRPHYARELNLKTQQSAAILCLKKTWTGKSHDHRDVIVFENFRSQIVLCPHKKRKAGSALTGVFEKFRFRDGLVWTVGLTVEIKLRFQIPLA